MPRHGRLRSWTERFSKRALFVSASALCIVPTLAQAGPRDNVPFVSLYGGYLFNDSSDNLAFDSDDAYLDVLDSLAPGDEGFAYGAELGAPITERLDWRASFTGISLDEADESGADGTETAYARDDLDLQFLDFELGYRPGVLTSANLRLFGGLRGLHSENGITYGYDDTADDKVGNYDRQAEFIGVGPRIGLEASVPLGDTGLSVAALGAGSAIFGRMSEDISFEEINGGTIDDSGEFERNGTQTVYNLEGRVALDYAIGQRANIEVGYQAQQFWNLVKDLDDVASEGSFADGDDGDVLVHGPYARFTVKFQ